MHLLLYPHPTACCRYLPQQLLERMHELLQQQQQQMQSAQPPPTLQQQQQQQEMQSVPLLEQEASAPVQLAHVLNSLSPQQATAVAEACGYFGQPAAPVLHWLLTNICR